jgi:ABC-type glutathione transport system ATPase component
MNPQETVKLLANLNLKQGTSIIMVTHDGQVAAHTERMLFLADGKITKEKEGLHLAKKLICPYCRTKLQPENQACPACGKSFPARKLQSKTFPAPGSSQTKSIDAKGDA